MKKIEEIVGLLMGQPVNQTTGQRPANAFAFDSSELDFLSLLNNLKTPDASSLLDSASLAQPDPAKAPISITDSLLLSARSSLNTLPTADTPPNLAAVDPMRSVNQEMDILRTKLSAEDVRFLKDTLPQALPLQGFAPLQDIFPVTQENAPEFSQMKLSKGLADLLEKAYKTGKPVRIDLDQRSSVILKISDGKVSAEFLSSDQIQAMYLRQHLADLRARMEARQLPIGLLGSRYDDTSGNSRDEETYSNPYSIEPAYSEESETEDV